MADSNKATIVAWAVLVGGVLALLVGIGGGLAFGVPIYKVWKAGKTGEATLRQAESEKKILIEQAAAEKEAAAERAAAIEIIGEAAKKYPEYRQQEFIGAFAEAMADGKIDQIIYVPTEANIPITEAGRLTPAE